jgi:polar amino acid transport system substrate-binding protein
MNKITLIMIIVLFAFLFAGCKNSNKLVIATDATYPPMEIVNDNKEIVGFDIDLFNEIAKAGGFQVEFKNTSWDGIFAGLSAGNYDAIISSVTITDERKKTIDFSDPYVTVGQVIILKKEVEGITTLDQMKGKTVGAQINTTGDMEVKKIPEIISKSYDENGLAIEDLINGRIDGVVCDLPTAANYVLQNDKYKDKLKIAGEPFTQEFYGIAVKKGNKKVLDKINAGLKKVFDSGINKELEKKWLK